MEHTKSIAPFGLRMPDDVRAWVKQAAEREDRSQNAVIVRTIRQRMKREQSEGEMKTATELAA